MARARTEHAPQRANVDLRIDTHRGTARLPRPRSLVNLPVPVCDSLLVPATRSLPATSPTKEIREYGSPFLGALREPGLIQLWTGIVARTAPGWSLLVRAPANVPRSGSYELFEGIIETDRWFGPLITNMRLTKTDVPIDFRADFPLLQLQPLPRQAYEDTTLNNYELVPELNQLTPEDWDGYYDTVVRPHVQEVRPRGQYAAAARKRRAAEDSDKQNDW